MARMTRQHFETIARAMRVIRPAFEMLPDGSIERESQVRYGMWAATVAQLMLDLRHTNVNFDSERFVKACGIETVDRINRMVNNG